MQLKPDSTSPVSRVDKHKARLSDRGYTPRRTAADVSARVEAHRTRLAESLNPREVPRNVQYPTRAPYKAPMATIPVRTTTAQDVQDELKKQTMLHTQQIRTLEQQQKSTLEPASLLNLQTQKNDLLKQAPSADQVKKSLLIQQSEQRLFNNPNDEDAWMQYVGNKFNPSASNQFQTDPAYNKTIKAAYAPEIKKEGEKSYWSAIGQSLKDQVTLGTKATFNTLAGLNAGGVAAQQASGIPSRGRSLGDMIETAKASDAEQRAVYQKEAVSAFDQMAQNKQDAVGDNALKDFVYDLAGVVPDMVVTLGLTALTGGGGVASMGAKQIAKGLAKKEARAAALKAIGTKLVVGPEMVPMGTKIFAQAYQQNIASGMDEERAFATSLVDAYGQSVLEGGGVNELFKAKGVKKLAQLGRSALGEGVEEVKQDVWSTAVRDTVGGVDTKLFSLDPNDQSSYVNPLRQGRALALGTAAGGGAAAVQAPAVIKGIVDTKLKPQVSAPDVAAKTTEYEKQTEQYKADLEAHTQAKAAHEQHTKAVTQYEMDLAKYNKAKSIVMPEERGWADVSSKKVKAFATEHPELKPAIQAHAIEVLNDLKYTQKGERSPIIDEEGYIAGYTGNKRTTSPTVEKILTATKTAPSYAAVTKALNDIIAGNSGADRALAKRIELILDDNLTNGYTSFDGAKIEENLTYKLMKNEIRPGYFGETFEAPKAPTPPAAIPAEPVAPTIDLSPAVDTSKMAPAVLNRLQADMASIGDQAQQVVELAAQGRTRSEIVETLGVAPKAVRAVMTLKGIPDVKSVEFARWRAAQNYGKATVEKTEAEVEQVITHEEAQARVDNIGVLAKTSAKAVQDLERGEVYVQRLGKRLGVDVVFYEGGKDTARGMFSAKESRTIFIDRESAKDGKVTMNILGHEFLHYIYQNHADLYKTLREVVGDTMTTEKVAKQLEKYKLDPEYQAQLANDKELLIEEMLAEEAGSLFTDKEFWANVAAKDENVAQKLIKLIGDFIDRILTGNKKDSGNLDVMTELQIKDFQKHFEAATASLVQQKKALQAANKAAAETKQATKKYTNPVETEAFKTWFGGSKVVDEQGNPKKLYTGHGNSAMYGAKFNPKLATAGAFYTTDNPEIASSYANQKIGQMEEYENGSQYKVGEALKDKISDVRLTKEQRDKAVALLNDEYGYDIEAYFKDNERYGDVRRWKMQGGTYNLGTYYSFLEQMGDTIAYAKEGKEPFFLRQQKNGFEDLMDTLGIDWSSYEWNQPGVMAVYLRVENPLDTNAEFPADLMAALEAAAKKERAQDWQHDAHWTKDYPLKAWVADIKRDYAEGGVHGWATQIPAKAAKIIKAHGYDGIKDVGGKNGGTGHEVWMAFEPNQIKSATGNKGTFSAKNNDMRLSVKMENEVFYTNSKVEVIKNPTDDQYIQLMQESRKLYPGEPAIRKTYDLEDNMYIWKAMDEIHAFVEGFINRKYDTQTNQNKMFPVRDLLQKNLGVNDKEALIGEQAIQELEAKFSSKAPTKIRTIARDFTEKLVNTGYVDFVGQTINDVDELAVMAQILRNPKFETLRYFFVDKNKQIVHHTGVSANVPGMTPAFEGYNASSRNGWLNQMVSTAKRQGATGFFMMHNHPSGNPVPSKEDYAVSAALRNTLWDMKFHGHLIINSSKYAFFDGAGADNKEHEIFDILMQDKLLVPDKPHALLGTQVSGPADMSLLAEKMKAKEGYTTIMYMSPANKLRGAQEVPTHLVDTIPNLQDFLKANALGFGGAHAVVLAENTKTFVAAKQLIEDSYVFEAIDMTNPGGTSARSAGAVYDPNKWMGSEPLGTKAWEPDAKYSTRMAAIEEAFKDSKIRNADGSLRRVQHGTNSEFTQFSASTFGENTGTSGFYGDGFYFTDNPYIPGAYGRNIMDVYLNITKPFILDRNTSVNQVAKLAGVTPITSNLIYNDNLSDTIMQDSAKFTQSLKKLGYDGVVLKDIFGDDGMPEIVAFYPEQIKSPNGDNDVDLENPDIRYSSRVDEGIEISMKEVKEPIDAKGWFKRLYQRVVDRALPIELTDETAGRLAANTSLVSGTLEHIMLRALVDSGGNVVGKSWKATAKSFHDNVDFWLYMANRHNVDRAREGKPVIPSRTQAESYLYYKSKEKEHPEYKTWGDDVTAWIDQFMQVWGIDTGVIDSVTYDLWRAMYPSYFPTYREFSDLEKMNGTGGGGKRFVDLPSPVKRATGSERNITNPVGNVMMMANKIVRTARYNAVGKALLDTVRSDPEGSAKFAEEIPANIGMFQSRKLDNVVSVFEEGHAAYLQINDKALLESLEGLPKVINNSQTVRKITNVYKGLITSYNPLFAIRNIFRDIPTAYVYGSQDNPLFFMGNLVKAGYQLTTRTGGAERYRAMGGAGSGQFSADEAAKYAALLQPSSAAMLKVPLKAIQFFNELTEQAPRVSEFNHVLKKTGDVQKALHAAQSVTVNFARGGDVTKRVEPFVPYLNASVQGIDTFFRKMIFDAGKNPSVVLKRWVKAGIAVTAPQIVSYLVSTFDDEDRKAYEQLDQRTKDTAYVFPKGDGTFWKIPKSRELGVLFGTLFERSIVGSFEGITGAVATNFLPVDPFQNNIASAFVYNLPMNEDFAGRKIVPEYMLNDKRSKALQYDDNTSEISKAIGARTNLSPKQIDYIVRSYTGVIGQFLIPATTARSGAGSAVERMTTGAFTADPAFSSQSMTNFYNRLDELGQIRTDKNIQESVPSKVVTSEERLYNLMNKVSANITKTTKYINANLKTDDPKVRQLRVMVNKYTGRAAKAEKPADVIKILAEMNAELYKNGVR